jgi:hypothetical protein
LGVRYDASCINLAAAAFPILRWIRDHPCLRKFRDAFSRAFCCGSRPSTWLFCSELVAQIYVLLGVFPESVNPADVIPTDFLPAYFVSPSQMNAVEPSTSASASASVKVITEKTKLCCCCRKGKKSNGQTKDTDSKIPWVCADVVRYHKNI